ncbi:ComEA family DNA-binding protein [Salegentibacter sediminis]|uniref:ComEA family DNA-binding protein n=1 Tax=Salegentibacter sediminis TaxID=1930251 RepID=UPI0009BFB229|nr:helix-hairpin-helix domain-containing protein [Salegentibacter sediminis]
MKGIRSHFVFSRNQQNGIFLLVLIAIVLQGVFYFIDFNTGKSISVEDEEIKRFQQQIDSIRSARAEADTLKIYPFNPNYITDYRGYTLGMSLKEIDRLHKYRAGDKWVNSAEEFQKVTGVSDSLLKIISPYFKFPEWVTKPRPSLSPKTALVHRSFSEKADLNTASAEELREINGIGEVLSRRIITYRNKIGGFVNDIQLKDIYGLDYETREKLKAQFTVKSKPSIELLNINEVGLLELSEVPYIGYELAREIIDYRLLHEKIDSFEELSKLERFPGDKIDRIQLYLSID